jgi:CRP-like cAMP-binding protein
MTFNIKTGNMSFTLGCLVLDGRMNSELRFDSMLETLTNIPLFQGLNSTQIELLGPLFERFTCTPETTIFEQGDQPQYLYILLKGTIIIRYKPYDGPPISFPRLHEGDVFGWSVVVGSKCYTSSSMSASDVEAIRIRGTDLWKLVRNHPETGKIILDRLAASVSPRWKDALAEVQALFNKELEQSKKEGEE